MRELFSVLIEGPALEGVKLNIALAPGGDFQCVQVAEDGSRVMFLADVVQDGRAELFSAPVEGPAAAGVKLNETLVSNGSVGCYLVSPAGDRVVYTATQEIAGIREIFSVPIEGPASAGLRLNLPLLPGRNVEGVFRISPDGQWVAYRSDREAIDEIALYTVPITGPNTEVVRVSRDLFDDGDVTTMWFSPDSQQLVYHGDFGFSILDDRFHIFTVPERGPADASTRVSGILTDGQNVHNFRFSFTPDGEHIVCIADQDVAGTFELYISNAMTFARLWDVYK